MHSALPCASDGPWCKICIVER